ncbi:cytochrome P450 [Apiospora phragmitis]|uniref:Cytochrome P450 n=1 Tax=Apiospora phragmitis TaxID=2905665 RepID=A0ABR1T8L1_9PEZI
MARSLELGSPVHQLFMNPFSRPLVVIDDPCEVADLLMRRGRDFDKSTAYGVWQTLVPAPPWPIRPTPTGRCSAPRGAFLRRVVGPHVYAAVLDLTRLWEARIGEMSSKTVVPAMDVSKDFSFAALDAIWASIFGERLDLVAGQAEAVGMGLPVPRFKGAMVAQTVDYVNIIWDQWGSSLWPGLSRWRITRSRAFRDYVALKDRETGRLLSEAAARLQTLVPQEHEEAGRDADDGGQDDSCLMDLVLRRSLLVAQKAGRTLPDPATNDDLKDELLLMIFAGHDTTSITLQWFVKYMTNNQEAQTKLRQALKHGFSKSTTNDNSGDLPDCAALLAADIPYLNAVMEETLRCASTASRGTRVATVDTEILGRPIPKGTQVLLSLNVRWKPVPVPDDVRSPASRMAKAADWVLHPAAQDLDRFRPEHWLKVDEHGQELFDSEALPRLSFSGGTRGTTPCHDGVAYYDLPDDYEVQVPPILEELNSPMAQERLLRAPLQCYVKLQTVASTNSKV